MVAPVNLFAFLNLGSSIIYVALTTVMTLLTLNTCASELFGEKPVDETETDSLDRGIAVHSLKKNLAFVAAERDRLADENLQMRIRLQCLEDGCQMARNRQSCVILNFYARRR
ncbi:hypothetical protein VCV18_012504 [Metarhizium anisopliae]